MKPEEILTLAADKLEGLLIGVTPGEWYADNDMGVYAYGEATTPPSGTPGRAEPLEKR